MMYFNCDMKGYIVILYLLKLRLFPWFPVFLFVHHHNIQLVCHHLFVCFWKPQRILAQYFATTTGGVFHLVTDVPVS